MCLLPALVFAVIATDAYAFAIEPVFAGLSALSEALRTVAGFSPGVNTSVLSLTIVETAGNPGFEESLPDPTRSALVMLLYAAVFVLVTALVFRQRDVT